MKKIAAVLVLACFAGSVLAQQTLKPEEMIKIRKSGYSFMSWNMGKIKANLDGSFNKEQVIAAANVVAATANSGMGALFGPGSDHEVGGQKTRVKAEFFQQPDKVKEAAVNFNTEANERALELADDGQTEEAKKILEDTSVVLQQAAGELSSPVLQKYADQNADAAESIEDEEYWGAQRKSMREEQSLNKTQRSY